MLKAERQKLILEELVLYNRVKSTVLCKKFTVSEDTVRRDLHELAKKGHLKKVHGGAVSLSYIPSFKKREVEEIHLKHLIAKKAVKLIKHGQVLIIDGGTTNMQLVNILPRDIQLTVFTNSIPVATKLCEYEYIDGILLGGNILKKGETTVGYSVLEALKEINADICFLGITSVHPDNGFTEANREETVIKKAIINASHKVASLVISKKLNSTQPFKVCELDQVDVLVTDIDNTDPLLQPYIKKGIEVL